MNQFKSLIQYFFCATNEVSTWYLSCIKIYDHACITLDNIFFFIFRSSLSNPLNEQVFETVETRRRNEDPGKQVMAWSPWPGVSEPVHARIRRALCQATGPCFIWALRAAVKLRLQDMIKASGDLLLLPIFPHIHTGTFTGSSSFLLKAGFSSFRSDNLKFTGLLYIESL